LDSSLYRSINRFQINTPWLHGVFAAVAGYGIVFFGVVLLAAWWIGRQTDDRHAVALTIWSGAAALIAVEIGQLIGGAVNRARPYAAMPASHALTARTTDFSFPSDHSTAAGAIAVGLLLAARPGRARLIAWITVAAALTLAFSRVYVGVHYPGDVLAGLALGAVVTAVGAWPALRLLEPFVGWLAKTRLRPLVTNTASVGA
jgi:membrane-associated phospholipid phosphatase